jgi:pimeloyl-ACP methyl ester carboxylesterase
MPPPRRSYIDGLHGQVHVRSSNARVAGRVPIVCFHATPMSGRSYEPFMVEVTDRPVYAIDTPGYGESDPPPGPLTIPEYTSALAQVIDALGLADSPIDLIGTHTGSRMAVELALSRPRQVRRLVLAGCAVYTEAERREQQRWSYELEIPNPEDTGGAQIRRLWESFEKYRRVGVTDALLERRMSEILRNRERSSWAHVGVFAHDLAPRLPLLEQPVLVINADDDLHEATQRAPALLRHGELVELSPAGFGVFESHPAQCAALVREFLDRR